MRKFKQTDVLVATALFVETGTVASWAAQLDTRVLSKLP